MGQLDNIIIRGEGVKNYTNYLLSLHFNSAMTLNLIISQTTEFT